MPILSRGGVGCAGHGGATLGARRDRRVTVAPAEPRSPISGGVLAHADTACSRSHQNMSFITCARLDLGAMLGGAGVARGGDGDGICAGSERNADRGGGVRDVVRALLCAGSERNADMGGGVRDVARTLLRAHGRRGVPDPVLL
jgi:hypothetical protein